MVGMREFYLIFLFLFFCRRIYLEVYVDACLILLDRYCHFNYCIHYFAMWIECRWLLLSMFSATCFIFMNVKIMWIMMLHFEKKK